METRALARVRSRGTGKEESKLDRMGLGGADGLSLELPLFFFFFSFSFLFREEEETGGMEKVSGRPHVPYQCASAISLTSVSLHPSLGTLIVRGEERRAQTKMACSNKKSLECQGILFDSGIPPVVGAERG